MATRRQRVPLTPDMFLARPFGGISEAESERFFESPVGFWGDAWIRLKRNRGAMAGLSVIVILLILAVIGPYLVPYSPTEQNISNAYQGPSVRHWFGTDEFGRDQWVRIWLGARVSLYIGFLAAFIDLGIGVAYGAISGYLGGRVDDVMQRLLEVIVGIPQIVVLILMLTVFSPGIITISLALGVVGWVGMALLIRGQVLKIKEDEHFLAARSLGAGGFRLIFKHLIPHVLGIMVIQLMFTIPYAIFFEAFLSFIGLGIQPPQASIGSLIASGFSNLQYYSYLLWCPAAILCLLMISFNLLADGARDAIDPKMRR